MAATSHRIQTTDGLQLQAYSQGDSRQPALILVHGYPDNHRVWHAVAAALADRFHVISYDVRGAGDSDHGRRLRDYRLAQLSADLGSVADQLIPGQSFHLAAHDWGSIQSWESVTEVGMAGRILSFTSISGPCLDHAGHWMRRRLGSTDPQRLRQGLGQLASSWYIVMFQLPWLAPALWQAGLGRQWPRYLQVREGVREMVDNPHQTDDGREGVQLYRANFMPRLAGPRQRHAQCPVQLIVPTRDNYVNVDLFEDLAQWVPELYRRDIDASHWVPLSHPDLIADWIASFASHVSRGDTANLSDLRVH